MSRENANSLTYREVTLFGTPALFTKSRIDRDTVPEGISLYEIRHSDSNWGKPIELARGIMVNYYGTVLTREPIQLPLDGWIKLKNKDLISRHNNDCTLSEYQQNYPASNAETIDFYSVNDPTLHTFYFSHDSEHDKRSGCIGHLRGDFGSGKEFYTSWCGHQNNSLNTPEFRADLDRTINWLRAQPGSPLKDLNNMRRYCERYMQSCAIKDASLPSCGFMIETKRYVYMLRCTPSKGEYNFYIYCYQQEKFKQAHQQHIQNTKSTTKKRTEPER